MNRMAFTSSKQCILTRHMMRMSSACRASIIPSWHRIASHRCVICSYRVCSRLKQIFLVEKQEDGCVREQRVVCDGMKQFQFLSSTNHIDITSHHITSHHIVPAAQRHDSDNTQGVHGIHSTSSASITFNTSQPSPPHPYPRMCIIHTRLTSIIRFLVLSSNNTSTRAWHKHA